MVNEDYLGRFDELLETYVSLDESAETIVRMLKKTPLNTRHKLIAELRNLEKKRLELLDQMDDRAKPSVVSDDSELLTQFEREILSEPYLHIITNRRHNWSVNVETLRPLWDCLMQLDAIWSRELSDLNERISTVNEVFPYFLFAVAHTKVHVVIDLCFSDYVEEAFSILRSVIESIAHAYRLLSRPELVKVWYERDKDAASLNAWKEEFWFIKESRLFEGLPDLYQFWKFCSDFGSHTNARSVFQRLDGLDDPTNDLTLRYTGLPSIPFPLVVSGILQFLSNLEQRLFDSCCSHLQVDEKLLEMRDKFVKDKLIAFEKSGILAQLTDLDFEKMRIKFGMDFGRNNNKDMSEAKVFEMKRKHQSEE